MPTAAAMACETARTGTAAPNCPRSISLTCARRRSWSRAPGCRQPLAESVAATLGGGRSGAAVSQPPRLCAAHRVPRLRPPHRLPQLRRLAGRAPFPPPAHVPSLRPSSNPRPRPVRMRRRRTSSCPCGPGIERLAEEAAQRFPDARIAILSSDLSRGAFLRDVIRDVGQGRIQSGDRHPAGGQGPSLSASDAGRRRRCRPGAGIERPARRRTHLGADGAGGGPRRTRRKAGPRPGADLSCRNIR